jgi:acetoin utilization protein AcuC
MNSNPVGFVYTDNYKNYDFGEGHPLTPKRIEMTYKLMNAYQMFDSPKIKKLAPRRATDSEIFTGTFSKIY